MLKAAALYIVIIISLLIAILTGSLLTIAFYYRMEMQKEMRKARLSRNLDSGTAILLSVDQRISGQKELRDLYGDQKDSVSLSKAMWGIYEINTVKAFELQDTLKKTFLSGISFQDPSAIYLADEDRPLSVSGKTQIIGDGDLPKAGLKQAYVDGKGYEGKELITGKVNDSSRNLPALNENTVHSIVDNFKSKDGKPLPDLDSIGNSFFNERVIYHLNAKQSNLGAIKLTGKIQIYCDSILNISSQTILEDVQIYAPAIRVEDGFKGSCQLFAKDSIVIGKHCEFNYPSFAGVFKPDTAKLQSTVKLGEASKFAGILMSYEKERSELQTMVSLGKNCLVKGQIFAVGYIKMNQPLRVEGKVYTKRFLIQTPSTLYENYLIDIRLDRKALNKYYLSSVLFNPAKVEQHILKWLN
ncbi:hypothetical protein DBR11_07500 [Pedobacter sp. HMWF019]|uniref:hypothetical protein n=1 Tax=Pedobacter sp. HMWF019 TaxID=2056856 RepID=UPI000D39C4C0|nr:hypothetical protein [Pedobacter sp. HMWF019]PTT01386.1 hypothetical protein DBR11_07500 [Pedobacter sp. HMWF019]